MYFLSKHIKVHKGAGLYEMYKLFDIERHMRILSMCRCADKLQAAQRPSYLRFDDVAHNGKLCTSVFIER